MPQAAYQSLLTPYVYFGLGRTNNYIENLFVGSTKHTDEHYINMEGVIPNSKVVIIPPAEGDAWRRELYLRPGEWIPWVTVTVIAALIILAIIVLVLHLNEKVRRSLSWFLATTTPDRFRPSEKTSLSGDERLTTSTSTHYSRDTGFHLVHPSIISFSTLCICRLIPSTVRHRINATSTSSA